MDWVSAEHVSLQNTMWTIKLVIYDGAVLQDSAGIIYSTHIHCCFHVFCVII